MSSDSSETEDVFLSDVHTEITEKVANNQSYVSRFQFKLLNPKNNNLEKEIYDEDGDLLTERENYEVIEIEHFMSTPLNQVGLQVWKGALLLSDFILENSESFDKQTVLELGAGPGLGSIVAGKFAKTVLATDYDSNVIALCHKNIERNQEIINGKVMAEILDWNKYESNWDLSNDCMKLLEDVSIILAADVIYSDELTDSFFLTLDKLIKLSQIKIIYISLEKRLNFTLEDLDITCPAYNHFKSIITSEKWRQMVKQEDVNFPQCFNYERNPQLELWTIKPQNVKLH